MAEHDVAIKSESTESTSTPTSSDTAFAPLMELRHRMDDLFEDFLEGWRMPHLRSEARMSDPFADFPLLPKLRGDFVDVKFDVSDSKGRNRDIGRIAGD